MNVPLRNSKAGAFRALRNLGLIPATVIDVGVQKGTPELYQAFPESVHILIEPVAEQEPFLKEICRQLPCATYVIAAASEHTGTSTLIISNNFQYAGLTSGPNAHPETHFHREIATLALDDLTRQANLPAPVLLKVDVDGAEMLVLKGASSLLREKAAYLVIEATLFGQIHEIINFMSGLDFVLYDIMEPGYRPLDDALWQVDLAFVPRTSPLRASREYADPDRMRQLMLGNWND